MGFQSSEPFESISPTESPGNSVFKIIVQELMVIFWGEKVRDLGIYMYKLLYLK